MTIKNAQEAQTKEKMSAQPVINKKIHSFDFFVVVVEWLS